MTATAEVDLGGRVAALRHERGWSQEHLAHRSGVTLNTIARIENGQHRSPRLNTLRGIAAALDTTIGSLVE